MTWTIKEEKLLEQMYRTHSNQELGVYFGRTPAAIMSRLVKLGLSRTLKERGLCIKTHHPKQWSAKDEKYLKDNYMQMSNVEMAKVLGRTHGAVGQRLAKLGLKRPEELSRQFNSGGFKKGHTTWNKGTKGLTGANKGSFQKGSTPSNHKPLGSERIIKDGYIEVKVAESKQWEVKQRVVYRQHFGEIPKSHVIIFKNGNNRDFSLENLECISRVENLNRNRNYKKQAQTLKDLWASEKLRVAYGLERKTNLNI